MAADFAWNACFRGHVGKSTIAFVAVQTIVKLGAALEQVRNSRAFDVLNFLRDGCAVDEVDIGFAVVVVVEDTDTRDHRFNQMPRRRGGVVHREL